MTVRLKPVEEQVVVLTEASSGIGLATTRALADRGAKLVLVSRNEAALQDRPRDCAAQGARAIAVAADVGRIEDMERVRRKGNSGVRRLRYLCQQCRRGDLWHRRTDPSRRLSRSQR